MRRALFAAAAFLASPPGAVAAVEGVSSLEPLLRKPDAYFASAEAAAIASNLLAYQRANGGWPKDLNMVRPLDPLDRERVSRDRGATDTTIDNGATVTQIRFLARLATATGQAPYRDAAHAGLDYLFAAEYPGGGWPQFFPLRPDYSRYVTFNDGAMAGVLRLLRDVSRGMPPFAFVDDSRRTRARAAWQRGIRYVLKAQVVVDGRRTVWCAQHDPDTFEPRPARAFELVSLSGAESVGLVEALLDVEDPSCEVIEAVESAVDWFRRSRLSGIRVSRVPQPETPGFDAVVVSDPGAPPLWARFYDVVSNRPFFAGRDGWPRDRLSEVERERRVGYAWYGTWPADLLERRYPIWRARLP